jgi:hypothetical protein
MRSNIRFTRVRNNSVIVLARRSDSLGAASSTSSTSSSMSSAMARVGAQPANDTGSFSLFLLFGIVVARFAVCFYNKSTFAIGLEETSDCHVAVSGDTSQFVPMFAGSGYSSNLPPRFYVRFFFFFGLRADTFVVLLISDQIDFGELACEFISVFFSSMFGNSQQRHARRSINDTSLASHVLLISLFLFFDRQHKQTTFANDSGSERACMRSCAAATRRTACPGTEPMFAFVFCALPCLYLCVHCRSLVCPELWCRCSASIGHSITNIFCRQLDCLFEQRYRSRVRFCVVSVWVVFGCRLSCNSIANRRRRHHRSVVSFDEEKLFRFRIGSTSKNRFVRR